MLTDVDWVFRSGNLGQIWFKVAIIGWQLENGEKFN